MKNFTKPVIASVSALALLAGAALAQSPQQGDTQSGSQTGPAANKSQTQPKAGAGGTMTPPAQQEKGGMGTQDVEKKAQQGAKQNATTPSKGGAATKSDTPMTATQDVEKKAQQGNMPEKSR